MDLFIIDQRKKRKVRITLNMALFVFTVAFVAITLQ